jgi:hypothetical protein
LSRKLLLVGSGKWLAAGGLESNGCVACSGDDVLQESAASEKRGGRESTGSENRGGRMSGPPRNSVESEKRGRVSAPFDMASAAASTGGRLHSEGPDQALLLSCSLLLLSCSLLAADLLLLRSSPTAPPT